MDASEQASTAEQVAQELVTLSRRLRNGARQIYGEDGLTFVEYSLLTLVDDHPGISAGALARAASIDKSTASRQLGELRRRDLLRRHHDASSPRTQALELTENARVILGHIRRRSGAEIAARLADWPPQDIQRFAEFLHRYNSSAPLDPI
ncbi:MarR family winged helix-turn-helix transcriptional regulator [Gordonia sp. DT30]|uniref:MarR family winged helix-turn-helix transcriptional regulator n=1 Tax=unclassified Gordonia (in: high G+C Gram-positive bacteria) TaxID=2657482 RepID=UPI003CF3249A